MPLSAEDPTRRRQGCARGRGPGGSRIAVVAILHVKLHGHIRRFTIENNHHATAGVTAVLVGRQPAESVCDVLAAGIAGVAQVSACQRDRPGLIETGLIPDRLTRLLARPDRRRWNRLGTCVFGRTAIVEHRKRDDDSGGDGGRQVGRGRQRGCASDRQRGQREQP